MVRLALIPLCLALLVSGCDSAADGKANHGGNAQVPPVGGGDADRGDAAADEQTKTPFIRTMLNLLAAVQTDDQQVKEDLRNSLVEADGKLRNVLGENSREAIMKANRKPLVPYIELGPYRPPQGGSVTRPGDRTGPTSPGNRIIAPTPAQ